MISELYSFSRKQQSSKAVTFGQWDGKDPTSVVYDLYYCILTILNYFRSCRGDLCLGPALI